MLKLPTAIFAKKPKDTDFMTISARVGVLETRLISDEQMEQILEAGTNADAVKLLQEHGYPELNPADPEKLDSALADFRQKTMEDLTAGLPDLRYLDLFRLRYDYHNAKAVLKAQVMDVAPDRMLMDLGRAAASDVRAAVCDPAWKGTLPGLLGQAIAEAREVLNTTRDPQLSDMVLDRWYYRDLAALAEEINSSCLRRYVQTQIDAANLQIWVRTKRMGKNDDFLAEALLEGGSIDPSGFLKAAGEGKLARLYEKTLLKDAAKAAESALQGGSLTEFEKLCDGAVRVSLSGTHYVPFGEEVLLRYLAAREAEYTNLRIVLSGRQAGIDPDVIRARLRRDTL